MNRKTFTIVCGAILLISFFLAYFSTFGFGVSGYDMVFGKSGGDWKKYIVLLIPISGALLLVGELLGTYILDRGLLGWLPFLAVIFMIFIGPLIDGASIGNIFKAIGKGYGIGLWLTIITSLALAFYKPRG